MKITKMQGLGNDFILTEELPADPAAAARRLCRRRLDIGADGLVLVLPSQKADLRMRIFNADGSEAEMCGNAIRCVARYAKDRGLVEGPDMRVETLAGIMRPQFTEVNGEEWIRVDMGQPDLAPERIPARAEEPLHMEVPADGGTLPASALLMGVPHAVLFVDEIDEETIGRLGPRISSCDLFPRDINVNFVTRMGDDAFYVRTWERGAGRTLACGTGSCAAAVAAVMTGRSGRKVRIYVEAGWLDIEVTDDGVFMTGPAAYVFEGETEMETAAPDNI
ncbi:MAG: diaminopimelate epimerase [Clostridia bacterium]|nr:diaminopimelate epimerase [Clostridia bacterium]